MCRSCNLFFFGWLILFKASNLAVCVLSFWLSWLHTSKPFACWFSSFPSRKCYSSLLTWYTAFSYPCVLHYSCLLSCFMCSKYHFPFLLSSILLVLHTLATCFSSCFIACLHAFSHCLLTFWFFSYLPSCKLPVGFPAFFIAYFLALSLLPFFLSQFQAFLQCACLVF